MATTRIIPLHASAGKSIGRSISDILDYGKNAGKTERERKRASLMMRMSDNFL